MEEDDCDAIDETDSNVTYTSFRQKKSKRSWSEKGNYFVLIRPFQLLFNKYHTKSFG